MLIGSLEFPNSIDDFMKNNKDTILDMFVESTSYVSQENYPTLDMYDDARGSLVLLNLLAQNENIDMSVDTGLLGQYEESYLENLLTCLLISYNVWKLQEAGELPAGELIFE